MTHKFEDAAESFLSLRAQNSYSPCLYMFIAASCYVELYRRASDEGEKERYAEEANELYNSAPSFAGKRKFGGRQIPFELFILRKMARYKARSSDNPCAGVGVSPTEIFVYLFCNGHKRMNKDELLVSLETIHWESPEHVLEADEKMEQLLLSASIKRHMGDRKDSEAALEPVLEIDRRELKNREEWVQPYALYEVQFCARSILLTIRWLYIYGIDEMVKGHGSILIEHQIGGNSNCKIGCL